MDKISIIVPVYNVEKYIKRCLESLISQTYKNIEIIVIIDGSPDNSIEICQKIAKKDKRIKIFSKENEGLGLTRNYGLERATGKYIVFVDSDDYVTHNMCESLIKAAKEHDADAVYGNIYYDNDGKIEAKKHIKEKKIWKGSQVKELLLDFIATTPNKKNDTIMEVSVWKSLFKKEIFDKNHIKFVSEKEFISEDVIFDIDFLSKSNCVVAITDYVYYYCVNPNSLSKTFRTDRFAKVKKMYFEVIRKLKELYPKDEYELRTDRFLIARARTNIRQIVKHKSVIGKEETKKAVAEICNDKDIISILARYNIKKMPLKYALIAFLIKYRKYNLLIWIFSILG